MLQHLAHAALTPSGQGCGEGAGNPLLPQGVLGVEPVGGEGKEGKLSIIAFASYTPSPPSCFFEPNLIKLLCRLIADSETSIDFFRCNGLEGVETFV